MSYIVRASWWDADEQGEYDFYWKHLAFRQATDWVYIGECKEINGTVTITKDNEVIREYKVGEDDNTYIVHASYFTEDDIGDIRYDLNSAEECAKTWVDYFSPKVKRPGNVTITRNGEVVREYKIGHQDVMPDAIVMPDKVWVGNWPNKMGEQTWEATDYPRQESIEYVREDIYQSKIEYLNKAVKQASGFISAADLADSCLNIKLRYPELSDCLRKFGRFG